MHVILLSVYSNSMLLIQLTVIFSCTALLIFWFYYAFLRTINSAPFLPSSYRKAKVVLSQLEIGPENSVS